MANSRAFALSALFLISLSALSSAAPLTVSVSGTFGSSITPTTLAAPGAEWSFSFNLDSSPAVSVVSGASFDVAFSSFQYTLSGKALNATPAFIRFYPAINAGLFTLFFGPESGFVNTVPIPEFEFDGSQAYSGAASAPTILTGSFPVSEWLYSDASNFQDQFPASNSVQIKAASIASVPEPSSLLLATAAAVALFASTRGRRPSV